MGRISRLSLFACIALVMIVAGCSRAGVPGLSVYLRTNADALDRPASVGSQPAKFTVAPGTPARVIAQDLEAAGLIRDALLFEAYVRISNLDSQLEAGVFVLDPSMTPREIAETLQHAQAAAVTLTIPEGWRVGQMADYMSEAGIFSDPEQSDLYRRMAGAGDLTGLDTSRYPFLAGRPSGTSLEGYLFPDTFELSEDGATAEEVLTRQLDSFAAKVMPLYAAASKQGIQVSLHEVLTLASIVEREAVVPEERPAIAAVYLNRLARGMRLEADPTVQYAMGYQPDTGQWWKTPVFLEEYSSVDSPYNTYLYAGLPPGPIAAPGLSSIQAVIGPDQHDYAYFVALPDGSGRHVFADTFEEHAENVRRYQQGAD